MLLDQKKQQLTLYVGSTRRKEFIKLKNLKQKEK